MHSHSTGQTGSVLITAIIFGFALFAAVAGYVYLTTHSMKLANRTFHMNSAMNLAEAGIEEGLYALNKFQGTSGATKDYSAWDNWDVQDLDRKRPFSYFSSNQGTEGEFTVIVTNWELTTSAMPEIIVRATSTLAGGGTIEKYVRATTSRRSFFSNALVARYDITFSGNNVTADSYDSRDGPYEDGVDVNGDGVINQGSNATVASASIEIDALDVGNADIAGDVATGGGDPDVGPQGSITGSVSKDFQVNFPPPPEIPGSINHTWSALPTSSGAAWEFYDRDSGPTPDGQSLSGNTKHYYLGVVPTEANPIPAPVRIKITSSISMGSSDIIFIQGPVILEFDVNFVSTGANSGIAVRPMDSLFNLDLVSGQPLSLKGDVAPLRIWTAGNFTLSGNGLTNPYAIPGSVQIYGTAPDPVPPSTTGTQAFDIKGNGDMAATVYAPNADLTIRGNGNLNGSFVANSIKASGMAAFHYDEALAESGTGKFSIALWRELITAAQRTGYTW